MVLKKRRTLKKQKSWKKEIIQIGEFRKKNNKNERDGRRQKEDFKENSEKRIKNKHLKENW